MTPALSVESLTDQDLFRCVSDALKQFHSVLLLARSPLADSQLVLPALVRDDLSPTAQERGQALRLVLRWAVQQLEPASPTYPLDEYRPWDDPTWQEPAWWRYNILRHRYLEPLHPDDFVEGGRHVESLLALTGIPTHDLYYEERARAIQEVAQWLRDQISSNEASDMLRQLALAEVYAAIRDDEDGLRLLTTAAIFTDVIPVELLSSICGDESVREPVAVIERLVAERYLLSGDEETIWLSPVLRRFLYQRERGERQRMRHRRIGHYYRDRGDTLHAVYHLQQAADEATASTLLLDDARHLLYEADGDELVSIIARFDRSALATQQWYRLQSLLADVHRLLSNVDKAIAACRTALQAAETSLEQAQAYRRLGKLYEQRSQQQALQYYAEATKRFEGTGADNEFAEMLKDRAWVHIDRGDFDAAAANLQQAYQLASHASPVIQADIHEGLASLYHYQHENEESLQYMWSALSLREASGDLLGVANSQNNLGPLFSAMDDHASAIAVYKEALNTYQRLGNREKAAATLLNLGAAYHLMDDRPQAILYYEEALSLCHDGGWHVTEAMAHSNRVEAYAELGEVEAAQQAWKTGITLARDNGLDSEVTFFVQMLEQYPLLQEITIEETASTVLETDETVDDPTKRTPSGFEADQALQLVRTHGRITARDLMQAADVSKATATRRLADLVDHGLLVKVGQGRGTHYRLPDHGTATAHGETSAAAPPDALSVLQQQRVLLTHYYGVSGLAIRPATANVDRFELIVRFDELPDLLTFFTLEDRLARALGRAVHLRPEASLSDDDRNTQLVDADWIWRA